MYWIYLDDFIFIIFRINYVVLVFFLYVNIIKININDLGICINYSCLRLKKKVYKNILMLKFVG